MKRRILLIEPNYKNKYPPIGLMKLATYHRMLGDDVRFFKGDLKQLIIEEICSELIAKLKQIDETIFWSSYYPSIKEYIVKGRLSILEELSILSEINKPIIKEWFKYFSNYYRKGLYKENPKWDRICITTLFTFHWKITVETIKFAKHLVKDKKEIWIGGILASVLHKEVKKETGISTFKGLLDKPGIMDKNDIIIDNLPLDYSILEEVDYIYPENNAYYGYMTRGCVRKCEFCVVWKLEPKFDRFIELGNKIIDTKKEFGEKRNLLLLDNNVLASTKFDKIIDEIKSNGFYKGATFIDPNILNIAIQNLREGMNDFGYSRLVFKLYNELLNKAKGKDKQKIYDLLDENKLLNIYTVEKKKLLVVFAEISPLYEKYRNKSPKLRYVDFNQGLDARLMTEDKMRLLSEIPIKPLRIAFDSLIYKDVYEKSVLLAAKYKIPELSNYLLYNFEDRPEELYERLEINVKYCEELDIAIFSFPMKFLPIDMDNFYMNRDYIGIHWNRKFLRAVQAILNSTKGKIGRGLSFFKKAFGKDINEYFELLYMPEAYLIYRYFFEHLGYIQEWKNDFGPNQLDKQELMLAKEIIEKNDFSNIDSLTSNKKILKLLKHYSVNIRESISDPNTELYELKRKYDKSGLVLTDVENYKYSLISDL